MFLYIDNFIYVSPLLKQIGIRHLNAAPVLFAEDSGWALMIFG